jgi:hypothetical protein
MTMYGLVISAAVALFFAVRYGRGWKTKWRLWMLGESPVAKPPRKDTFIT